MEIRELLEPIADIFRNFTPEPIVHWGHPLMMAIVVFVMGSFVGLTGWRRRVITDEAIAVESASNHRKMAPFMFLFISTLVEDPRSPGRERRDENQSILRFWQ